MECSELQGPSRLNAHLFSSSTLLRLVYFSHDLEASSCFNQSPYILHHNHYQIIAWLWTVWKPPGREERLISVSGWVTVGSWLLENDHSGCLFCFCSYASKLFGSRQIRFCTGPCCSSQSTILCLVARKHSHQSPPEGGTRRFCFHKFYSNLVISTDFDKFISKNNTSPTHLKVTSFWQ